MKKINPVKEYFYRLVSMFRTNIRDYGMYIALAVIFIIFTSITGGLFLQPYNFTNLLNQTAYVAVLAVGMTLVIVTREIDLSVGYLGAFLGGLIVVMVERDNMAVIIALLIGLVITIAVGFVKGSLIARIKIPSFVVTLGAMFIFKGLLMSATKNTTIPTSNRFFQAIGIGYLSTYSVGPFNLLTLILGVLVIALLITTTILTRVRNKKHGIKNEKMAIFITKLVFMLVVIGFVIYTLASFRGISYQLLITIIVTVIYHFVTTRTVLGRRIYAVGGNPEAAELSGINVKGIVTIIFISMGVLAMISGIMYASRVQNTSPQHGASWELYAIAAAYIGGTSARGGVGKVVNAVVGAIVIMSLRNGMALAGIASNVEPVILGGVLVLAVIFDIYTRNVKPVDYVGIYYANELYEDFHIARKATYLESIKTVRTARKDGIDPAELIEMEYEHTRLSAEYTRVNDLIRNAKEEDYISISDLEMTEKIFPETIKKSRFTGGKGKMFVWWLLIGLSSIVIFPLAFVIPKYLKWQYANMTIDDTKLEYVGPKTYWGIVGWVLFGMVTLGFGLPYAIKKISIYITANTHIIGEEKGESEFSGRTWPLFGWMALFSISFIVLLPLPFVFPKLVMWLINNKTINGKRLKFSHTGPYWGIIGWILFSFVTLGFGAFYSIKKMIEWIVKRTHFEQ